MARRQLLTSGVHSEAIKHRVRSGRLHPVHRGVYLVGHASAPHGAREMAAVLACGRGAVVSHVSAANLLQLLPYPANPAAVHVTVRGRDAGRIAGVSVHRVAALDACDIRAHHGIPTTTPARTLLDLAATAPLHVLERAHAEAQVRRVVRERDLVEQLERNPGRRGTRTLRGLLQVGPALTRSEAERRLLKLVRVAHLPLPETNARLERYEVDFLWRERRLVVEVDGFRFHSSRAAFERDRERDAALASSGYTVLRVTWRQLFEEREAVLARIAAALAVRA